MHYHEMVWARRRWWDEKVFNDYPTWEEAVEDRLGYFSRGSAKNSRPLLERYFGEADEFGGGGPGAYTKCVTYGIGRVVLAKMLNLNPSEVEEALRNLPLTERARRGLELRAQEAREEAERLREQAQGLEGEEKAAVEHQANAANARAGRDEERIPHARASTHPSRL